MTSDAPRLMRMALRLAGRGYGSTSPNPMVGAVLVKRGEVIGRGWHRRAGEPHAEIEAIRNARKRGCAVKGATLYVTLEPCCTQGRTPPCSGAIIAEGIKEVIVGATDPNPAHKGKAFGILRRAGVAVSHGVLEEECQRLNEAFNHWIVHRTPFVTVKAAMTLDGKIATATGESKWITGEAARGYGMCLRQGADAILVGINTILADDPSLTFRGTQTHSLRRIVLDAQARTPLGAKVLGDQQLGATTIVVSELAPEDRVAALAKRVQVLVAPVLSRDLAARLESGNRQARVPNSESGATARLDLPWLLRQLGAENVTSLLVEGGGEVNSSFLFGGWAHRVAFFYAPKILGGRHARPAVAGYGAQRLADALTLSEVEWRPLGADLLLTGRLMGVSRAHP